MSGKRNIQVVQVKINVLNPILFLTVFVTLMIPIRVSADSYWGVGDGNWNDSANWSGGIPVAGEDVFLRNTTSSGDPDYEQEITITYGLNTGPSYGDITLGSVGNRWVKLGLVPNSILQSDYLFIDDKSVITNLGGNHTATNRIVIGRDSIGTARYELFSGSLNSPDIYLGTDSGAGRMTHSGGGTITTQNLHVGTGPSSYGEYGMSSGILNAGVVNIGEVGGDGEFRQTGSSTVTNIGSNLYVGRSYQGYYTYTFPGGWKLIYDRSFGTYELSAGQLGVTGDAFVGYRGTGTFQHSDATHTVSGDLFLGYEKYEISSFIPVFGQSPTATRSGSGTYNLSGTTGLLSATNEYIGYEGTGTFNQSGSLNSITNNLYLATQDGSRGTYNLAGGALNIGGNIIGGAGNSALNLDGGNLTYSGNSITVNTFGVGYNTGTTGAFTLESGKTLSADQEYIGHSGSGSMTQLGGSNTTDDFRIGFGSSGSGAYTLQGGSLTAQTESVSRGTFTHNGGSNNTDSLFISVLSSYHMNNGTLTANEITNVGQFRMMGGNVNANIDNRGTLSGTGTITGDVNNLSGFGSVFGTVSPGASPGTLTVDGNFMQDGNATLLVELGGYTQGVDYDWLNVSGTATLGGVLDILLYDFGGGPFQPVVGDTFDILTADTIEGQFDLLSYALDDGLMWNVSYILDDLGDDFVRLSLAEAVPPIPIPAAVWLFGTALLGLVGFTKRKKSVNS